jgi:hypothetical protein
MLATLIDKRNGQTSDILREGIKYQSKNLDKYRRFFDMD